MTMTNKLNITALVQTAERLIREVQGTKKTIGAVCAEWNRVCHESGIGNCKLSTPRKRATLVHELFEVIQVLNIIDERCDAEGNDSREWCGKDIEVAHAMALAIEAAHTDAIRIDRHIDDMTALNIPSYTAMVLAFKTLREHDEAHTEALEENKRFDWLHNRWCLFYSSSRLQQEEVIAVAWEQARHITEAEAEYQSQKQRRLEAIWKHTHRDYKGESDGVRTILVCRNGTTSVPLESLSDAEIEQRSSCWK
jgi:hypothetical protein